MRPAQLQILIYPDSTNTIPFGLIHMDNGETAILCSREKEPPKGRGTIEPIIAFSKDDGATWTEFTIIAGTTGRPMNLTDHGKGRLSFVTNDKPPFRRHFSNDFGRTWSESVDTTPSDENRHPVSMLRATAGSTGMARAGPGRSSKWATTTPLGKATPRTMRRACLPARSTCQDLDRRLAPPEWKFTVEHKGKKWLRGVHEGAIVRAANGDLVAALRTGEPPPYFDGPPLPRAASTAALDNLCGTAISISRDDGKTWSEMQFLFKAGYPTPICSDCPTVNLVCTLIVRNDIQDGKPPSDRQGCDGRSSAKTMGRPGTSTGAMKSTV